MRSRHSLLAILVAAALSACSDHTGTTDPTPPPITPDPAVLLKDVVIANLPAPYYHFDYDAAGRIVGASFASGFTMYDVTYDGDRIKEMRNNIIVNHDRLTYSYDEAGRVSGVTYADANGVVYVRLFFAYDGQKLVRLERNRKVESGYLIDKTMVMSYYPDGNLRDITEHLRPGDGAPETTSVEHFEQYDDKINVDGFGLIHDEFFDHLVLLPGVQLQKGNPGRETRTGDGTNFSVDYSYTYDARNRPLTKTGVATLTNGPDAGRQFQLNTVFSYY